MKFYVWWHLEVWKWVVPMLSLFMLFVGRKGLMVNNSSGTLLISLLPCLLFKLWIGLSILRWYRKTVQCHQCILPPFWLRRLSRNGSDVVHVQHTIPCRPVGFMIYVVVIYHGLLLWCPEVTWGWHPSWIVCWVGLMMTVLDLSWSFVMGLVLLLLEVIICPTVGLGSSCQNLPGPPWSGFWRFSFLFQPHCACICGVVQVANLCFVCPYHCR